jgi:hypothetical protein
LYKFIKIIVFFIVAIAAIYAILDYNYYFPEKHKIIGVDFRIFEIDDSSQNLSCYKLKQLSTHSNAPITIVGIRFKFDYESIKHEHFIFTPIVAPKGFNGNIDTIQKVLFEINTNDGPIVFTDSLKSAEKYRHFILENEPFLNRHSRISKDCYLAEAPENIDTLIENYNTNKIGFDLLENFQFFVIPLSLRKLIIKNKTELNIQINNHPTIKAIY